MRRQCLTQSYSFYGSFSLRVHYHTSLLHELIVINAHTLTVIYDVYVRSPQRIIPTVQTKLLSVRSAMWFPYCTSTDDILCLSAVGLANTTHRSFFITSQHTIDQIWFHRYFRWRKRWSSTTCISMESLVLQWHMYMLLSSRSRGFHTCTSSSFWNDHISSIPLTPSTHAFGHDGPIVKHTHSFLIPLSTIWFIAHVEQ